MFLLLSTGNTDGRIAFNGVILLFSPTCQPSTKAAGHRTAACRFFVDTPAADALAVYPAVILPVSSWYRSSLRVLFYFVLGNLFS